MRKWVPPLRQDLNKQKTDGGLSHCDGPSLKVITLVTPYKKIKHTGSITLYAHWSEGGTATEDDNTGSSSDTGTGVNDASSAVVTSSRTKIKKADLKKADQIAVLTVSGCDCTVKYKNATSGKLKKYVSVSKNGTVTISKGAPKGTVKIKVTLTPVKGGDKITQTVKIKIK